MDQTCLGSTSCGCRPGFQEEERRCPPLIQVLTNLSRGGPLRSTNRSEDRMSSRIWLAVLLTAEKPCSHSADVGRYVRLAMNSLSNVFPGAVPCNFQSRNCSTVSLVGSPSAFAKLCTSGSPCKIRSSCAAGQKRLSRALSISTKFGVLEFTQDVFHDSQIFHKS